MSAHTPGPWEIVRSRKGYPYQIKARNGSTGPGGIIRITRWASISFPSSDEAEANARLLAAAPELLGELRLQTEALERLAFRLDSEPGNQTLVDMGMERVKAGRAAIAKATEGQG